ncbi:MAG: DEAD/DEAH box helicase family protein, partial [Planctomycetota bacterium]|nr:DEAD/DEAH box helicase family protein [Planctomycetota bacterium]
MRDWPSILRTPKSDELRAVVQRAEFPYPQYDTCSLPDRVYSGQDDAERPSSYALREAEIDIAAIPTCLEVLTAPSEDHSWPRETRASIGRLEALWLLLEDRHRLLDSEVIDPLVHQLSLVDHVLSHSELDRVLIADEVGLGKTITAGLILRRLKERNVGRVLRTLYLTQARLVGNVIEEFEKLGLHPRAWTSDCQEARLTANNSDSLVVASIHRAVYSQKGGVNNLEMVSQSGPWDLLIIDEAHHLSDWSDDGKSPKRRMKLIRTLVEERLVKDGRLILLTATPHQGHDARFRNLLRLLDPSGNEEKAKGKVIYRIKDDIKDWEGRPLFPVRHVHAPTKVRVSQEYQQWLEDVYRLFTPKKTTRPMAWRRAQALQWCASSPNAGLAYLARSAYRHGDTGGTIPELKEALLALRPYRGGGEDESFESLEKRLIDALKLPNESDGEESLNDTDPLFTEKDVLAKVLKAGTALIETDAIAEKLNHIWTWLDNDPKDKFVIFAQPIETVHVLKRRLEQRLGQGSVV